MAPNKNKQFNKKKKIPSQNTNDSVNSRNSHKNCNKNINTVKQSPTESVTKDVSLKMGNDNNKSNHKPKNTQKKSFRTRIPLGNNNTIFNTVSEPSVDVSNKNGENPTSDKLDLIGMKLKYILPYVDVDNTNTKTCNEVSGHTRVGRKPHARKDSLWLRVETCRDFCRGLCRRGSSVCSFAHPSYSTLIERGFVTTCYDSMHRNCFREKCKFFHPPIHIQHEIEIMGKTNRNLNNKNHSGGHKNPRRNPKKNIDHKDPFYEYECYYNTDDNIINDFSYYNHNHRQIDYYMAPKFPEYNNTPYCDNKHLHTNQTPYYQPTNTNSNTTEDQNNSYNYENGVKYGGDILNSYSQGSPQVINDDYNYSSNQTYPIFYKTKAGITGYFTSPYLIYYYPNGGSTIVYNPHLYYNYTPQNGYTYDEHIKPTPKKSDDHKTASPVDNSPTTGDDQTKNTPPKDTPSSPTQKPIDKADHKDIEEDDSSNTSDNHHAKNNDV